MSRIIKLSVRFIAIDFYNNQIQFEYYMSNNSIQQFEFKKINFKDISTIKNVSILQVSIFGFEIPRQQSKEIQVQSKSNIVDFKTNIALACEQECDFQIDLNADANLVGSTLFSTKQISDSKKGFYSLALVNNNLEVAIIDLSISLIKKNSTFAKSSKSRLNLTKPILSNQYRKHNMTAQSWADPINNTPDPGTYQIDTDEGLNMISKIKNPSFTMGAINDYRKLQQSADMVKNFKGSEGPDIKQQPKLDYIKNRSQAVRFDKVVKIDEKLANNLIARSPGPVQDTTSTFINKHSPVFGSAEKLKFNNPNKHAGYLAPDVAITQKSTVNTYTPENHETWHKTQSKEKERYMTCLGEPAIQSEKNVKIDLGAKQSVKYSISSGERQFNKRQISWSPGPGQQTKGHRYTNHTVKQGTFSKGSKKFNVQTMFKY